MNVERVKEQIKRTDERIATAYAELKIIKDDIDRMNENIRTCNEDLESLRKCMINGSIYLPDELKAAHLAKKYIKICEKNRKEKERNKKRIMFELAELVSDMIDLKKEEKNLLEYSDTDYYDDMADCEALWDTERDEGSEDEPLIYKSMG